MVKRVVVKPMTAKAIAKKLDKKIIIVNLASIVSSKLGETAKNIEGLFKEVNYESAVLFFLMNSIPWGKSAITTTKTTAK